MYKSYKRMNNAKSDIKNPEKSSVPYAQHFNKCSKLTEPYSYCFPLYYEHDTMFRRFKEWCFIKRLKPQLNLKL